MSEISAGGRNDFNAFLAVDFQQNRIEMVEIFRILLENGYA